MEHGPAPGHDANRPVQGLEDSHVLYTTTRAGLAGSGSYLSHIHEDGCYARSTSSQGCTHSIYLNGDSAPDGSAMGGQR